MLCNLHVTMLQLKCLLQPTPLVFADDCLGDLVCGSKNVCANGQAVGAHCSATGMQC